MNKKQIKWRNRILIAIALFFAVMITEKTGALGTLFGEAEVYAAFALYFVAFLIAGHDVLVKAWNNIRRGDPFDEAFLMTVATLGAFATILFPETEPQSAEGCAVMLFYQVGELFQSYAVGDIAETIGATQSAVSHQLRILKQARLVRFDRDGRSIIYSLADDHVHTMLAQGMNHICE